VQDLHSSWHIDRPTSLGDQCDPSDLAKLDVPKGESPIACDEADFTANMDRKLLLKAKKPGKAL